MLMMIMNCFCEMVNRRKFPAGTNVRDSHHFKSSTRG